MGDAVFHLVTVLPWGGAETKGIVFPQRRSLAVGVGVLYRTGAVARWFNSILEKGQGVACSVNAVPSSPLPAGWIGACTCLCIVM